MLKYRLLPKSQSLYIHQPRNKIYRLWDIGLHSLEKREGILLRPSGSDTHPSLWRGERVRLVKWHKYCFFKSTIPDTVMMYSATQPLGGTKYSGNCPFFLSLFGSKPWNWGKAEIVLINQMIRKRKKQTVLCPNCPQTHSLVEWSLVCCNWHYRDIQGQYDYYPWGRVWMGLWCSISMSETSCLWQECTDLPH